MCVRLIIVSLYYRIHTNAVTMVESSVPDIISKCVSLCVYYYQ